MQALRSAAGRTATIAIMVTAIIAGLLGVLYGLWVIDDVFDTEFWFTAPVASPIETVPIVQGTTGESFMQYHEVSVRSYEALAVPRTLLAVSHTMHFLLFVLACAAAVILCVRLLRRRNFTRVARWSMLVIGMVALATSIAAPWLHSLSGRIAARELGIPTSGEASVPAEEAEWIVPHVFTLQDTNWSLAVLGLILLLIAATYLRGERLQRDTEGLI